MVPYVKKGHFNFIHIIKDDKDNYVIIMVHTHNTNGHTRVWTTITYGITANKRFFFSLLNSKWAVIFFPFLRIASVTFSRIFLLLQLRGFDFDGGGNKAFVKECMNIPPSFLLKKTTTKTPLVPFFFVLWHEFRFLEGLIDVKGGPKQNSRVVVMSIKTCLWLMTDPERLVWIHLSSL